MAFILAGGYAGVISRVISRLLASTCTAAALFTAYYAHKRRGIVIYLRAQIANHIVVAILRRVIKRILEIAVLAPTCTLVPCYNSRYIVRVVRRDRRHQRGVGVEVAVRVPAEQRFHARRHLLATAAHHISIEMLVVRAAIRNKLIRTRHHVVIRLDAAACLA